MTLKHTTAFVASILLFVALPANVHANDLNEDDIAIETGLASVVMDHHGKLLMIRTVEPTNPDLYRELAFTHKPNHGGGGGGGGGGGSDCTSNKYRLTGHHWTGPWSAKASSYASVLNSAGNTWEAETSANIFGGITSGSNGVAGVQDFNNQIDWAFLGAGGTVAVTTTWYYRGSGEAVESDAQYNTYYPWATNGDPNSMDVAHVGTHEIGHTFGLDHPNGPGIECLTMYAYVDFGQTHGATLGDGDVTGIQSLYGA